MYLKEKEFPLLLGNGEILFNYEYKPSVDRPTFVNLEKATVEIIPLLQTKFSFSSTASVYRLL